MPAETETTAIVLEAPEQLGVRRVGLRAPTPADVVVDVEYSGISTGTERLLWSGRMPSFPGMGYPLVPGYESVGRIVEAGAETDARVGERVFVPGATCYTDARGLFGGSAQRLITAGQKVIPLPDALDEDLGVLFALAGTAEHAIAGGTPPDLIVGHGVLGRLLARLTLAHGHPAPTVWEINPARRDGADGYAVVDPESDERRDYRAIYDVSGAKGLLDQLIGRLGKGGEVVLAGFYEEPLSFQFPQAFIKEARLRIAAEFQPADLAMVRQFLDQNRLSMHGLITHHRTVAKADEAYRTAFEDASCLKMVVDWRQNA